MGNPRPELVKTVGEYTVLRWVHEDFSNKTQVLYYTITGPRAGRTLQFNTKEDALNKIQELQAQ